MHEITEEIKAYLLMVAGRKDKLTQYKRAGATTDPALPLGLWVSPHAKQELEQDSKRDPPLSY